VDFGRRGRSGINFISFTAQNNALHMLSKKGDFWHLGGMAPLPPLNLPMVEPGYLFDSRFGRP